MKGKLCQHLRLNSPRRCCPFSLPDYPPGGPKLGAWWREAEVKRERIIFKHLWEAGVMPITFYGWGTQGPERKNPGLTPGHRASLLGLSKTSSRSALGRFQVPDKLGDSMENADWPWPAFGPQQGQAASGVAELACRTEMGQVRAGWGRKPRPTPGGQPQALPPRPVGRAWGAEPKRPGSRSLWRKAGAG